MNVRTMQMTLHAAGRNITILCFFFPCCRRELVMLLNFKSAIFNSKAKYSKRRRAIQLFRKFLVITEHSYRAKKLMRDKIEIIKLKKIALISG